MSKRKTGEPSGHSPHEPSMDGGLSVLMGPTIAGAKHVYDAVKEAQAQIKANDPLRFTVLDCQRKQDGHELQILCKNCGQHGVYLEKLVLKDPVLGSVSTSVRARDSFMSFPRSSSDHQQSPVLPVLVPGGEEVRLAIQLLKLDPERLKRKPCGKLVASYTVLGVAETGLDRQIEFSIPPWQAS